MRSGNKGVARGFGRYGSRALAALLMLPGLGAPVLAGNLLLTPEPMDEAFFGVTGRMMAEVYNPFGGYEDNYYLGAGYQRLPAAMGRSQRLPLWG